MKGMGRDRCWNLHRVKKLYIWMIGIASVYHAAGYILYEAIRPAVSSVIDLCTLIFCQWVVIDYETIFFHALPVDHPDCLV